MGQIIDIGCKEIEDFFEFFRRFNEIEKYRMDARKEIDEIIMRNNFFRRNAAMSETVQPDEAEKIANYVEGIMSRYEALLDDFDYHTFQRRRDEAE